MVYTFLFSLIFLFIGLFLIKKFYYIPLLKKIEDKNFLLSSIINNLNYSWCYWSLADELAHCSQKLQSLIGIKEKSKLESLFLVLGESPFSPFRRAIKHLKDYGGVFTLRIVPSSLNQCLEICGTFLDLSKEGNRKNQQFIILSISDITRESQTIKELELLREDNKKEINELKVFLNSIPIPLWARGKNGRIKHCNLSYAEVLELSVPRIIAENKDFLQDDDALAMVNLTKKVTQYNKQHTIKHPMVILGQRCLMELSEVPSSSTLSTVGYALNVTAFEEAQKGLIRQKKEFHEVLNYVSSAIAIFDESTKITFFNQGYIKTFSFDESWLYNKPTFGEILEDLRARRKLQEYQNFPEHKKSRLKLFKNLIEPTQEILNLPDGQTLRLIIAPYTLGGLLFLFEDLTDRLGLERDYKTLTAVQKETLDHLYEGILVFGIDYRLQISNPALRKILGIKTQDFQHISEFIENISSQFNNKRESVEWSKRLMEILGARRAKRGQIFLKNRFIHFSYTPLSDGSHLISFIDLSDSLDYHQELDLFSSQKEFTKKMINQISQEIYQPLTKVEGVLRTVNQEESKNKKISNAYEEGIITCVRLKDSMETLCDIWKVEAGLIHLNQEEIELSSVLIELKNFIEQKFPFIEVSLRNVKNSQDILYLIDCHRFKNYFFCLIQIKGYEIKKIAFELTKENTEIKIKVLIVDSLNINLIETIEYNLLERFIVLSGGRLVYIDGGNFTIFLPILPSEAPQLKLFH